MSFTFITDEGIKQTIGTKKAEEPKPWKAAARSALTSGLGSYGNIASLIPGHETGSLGEGEKQKYAREAALINDPKAFTQEILANAASDADLLPPLTSLPSSQQVDELLTQLGFPEKETTIGEKYSGRVGRLFGGSAVLPGVGIPLAASTALTGALGGQIAENAGLSPSMQSLAEILSSLRGSPKQMQKPLDRIRQPRSVASGLPPKETGIISQNRSNQQISRINKEASELAKNVGSENKLFSVISQSIDSNHPIQEKFSKVFEGLEHAAKENNIPINASKLEKFLSDESSKFEGIGAPTDLSRFIKGEISGWQDSGSNNLYSTFRRYRLNNQRIGEVIKTYPPGSTRNQMIGFLSRMNDSIKESFSETFKDKENLWMNGFEKSNEAYSNFLNTKQAKSIIDPILNENLNNESLNKFLSNANIWESLDRFLGVEDSGKLKQILEDMRSARNSLMSFTKGNVQEEAVRHLIFSNIKGLGKLRNLIALPRAWQWIKGKYYSSPDFGENFHELVLALAQRNIPAAKDAIDSFENKEIKKKSNTQELKNKIRFIKD